MIQEGRSDRGTHRIGEDWRTFIVNSHSNGKRTPAQVAIQVQQKANAEQLDSYPSHVTVYRTQIGRPLVDLNTSSLTVEKIFDQVYRK